MELFNLTYQNKPLRLEGSMAGWQVLYWDNQIVSQLDACQDNEKERFHTFTHCHENADIEVKISNTLTWQPFHLHYKIYENGQLVTEGARVEKDIQNQTPVAPTERKSRISILGIASLGFKLLKSAKVIKVLLAGASVAAYSWLFSWQFALSLIACLVFHEYGHIRAMKYFGMKTKGIYLIPFVGGLAVPEDKMNTRWQDVVISIMGPTFGLLMSFLCMLAYWITENPFFAGLASFNALLNIFNLLPVLPLDGGRIIKSISFSFNHILGLITCLGGILIGVLISYTFGLALLAFMLIIGSLDIIFEWKLRHQSDLLPLNRYAQLISAIWYIATIAAFVSIIFYFANLNEALNIPLIILSS